MRNVKEEVRTNSLITDTLFIEETKPRDSEVGSLFCGAEVAEVVTKILCGKTQSS